MKEEGGKADLLMICTCLVIDWVKAETDVGKERKHALQPFLVPTMQVQKRETVLWALLEEHKRLNTYAL